MDTDTTLIIMYDKPILGVTGNIMGLKINGKPATFIVITEYDNIIDRINEKLFNHSIIFIPDNEKVINELESQNIIKCIYIKTSDNTQTLLDNGLNDVYRNILLYYISGNLTNSMLLDIYKTNYNEDSHISEYTMRRNHKCLN